MLLYAIGRRPLQRLLFAALAKVAIEKERATMSRDTTSARIASKM